jgi:hypothetical protein
MTTALFRIESDISCLHREIMPTPLETSCWNVSKGFIQICTLRIPLSSPRQLFNRKLLGFQRP